MTEASSLVCHLLATGPAFSPGTKCLLTKDAAPMD